MNFATPLHSSPNSSINLMNCFCGVEPSIKLRSSAHCSMFFTSCCKSAILISS
ncbi:unknown function, no known homologues [Haemophilus influenzae F3047]|uniref:Uncharacterized protein n=1 Tax=Haemophilus influenzae F3047 TaxID=935897 RepID=A0AAV2U570_HAEIF|nr:unknown function, no known homologues [Haemophilus influenzae F3047]